MYAVSDLLRLSLDVSDHIHVEAVETGLFANVTNLLADIARDLFKVYLIFGNIGFSEKDDLQVFVLRNVVF
jgi:hypothetical protein